MIFPTRHPLFEGIVIATSATLLSAILYVIPRELVGYPRLEDYVAQTRNPFTHDLSEPILAYRIVAPGLAWLIGLRGLSGVAVPLVASVINIVLIYRIVLQHTSRLFSALLTAALSLTFLTQWTENYPGYGDAVSFLMMSLCIWSSRPSVRFLGTALGILNDERFMMAAPLLAFWSSGLQDQSNGLRLRLREAAPIVVGVALALTVRHGLQHGWIGTGFQTPPLYGWI